MHTNTPYFLWPINAFHSKLLSMKKIEKGAFLEDLISVYKKLAIFLWKAIKKSNNIFQYLILGKVTRT